ncbi:hypothetical protein AHAS_Ahas16G0186600 [Arachis hypogaea]
MATTLSRNPTATPPPLAPPPQSPQTLARPPTPPPPALSQDEVVTKQRNKDEVRTMFESYRCIKLFLSKKQGDFIPDLEQSFFALVNTSRVFSTSISKEDEALNLLSPYNYVISSDQDQMKPILQAENGAISDRTPDAGKTSLVNVVAKRLGRNGLWELRMGVIRLARAYTENEKIIKFEGCYHGHADPFLVKAGSGVATLGLPDFPGVPKGSTYETLTAPFNDFSAVDKLFEDNKGEIAAVMLKPVVGNSGFIPPKSDFLSFLRKITKENNSLLIFDEVMTGFRLAYGSYGGRMDIMEMVAPAGPMYQAGTLSGNPLAMTAGTDTLKCIKEAGTYEYLDKITGELVRGIVEAGKKAGHAICGGHISGMFGFFFTEGPVYNFADAKKSDTTKFAKFYWGMLAEGVYLAPSQFQAGFTSLAHSPDDIEKTIAAAEKVFIDI